PTLPVRARAASESARPTRALSAAARATTDAPRSPKCPRPSAGAGRSCGGRQDAVGPRVDRVALRDALAQRSPDLGTLGRAQRGKPAQALGQAVRRIALEEEGVAGEEVVEHRVR